MNLNGPTRVCSKGRKVICTEDKIHLLLDDWLMDCHPLAVLIKIVTCGAGELIKDFRVGSKCIVVLLKLEEDGTHEFEAAGTALIKSSGGATGRTIEPTAGLETGAIAPVVLVRIIKTVKHCLEFADLILEMKQDAVVQIIEAAVHGVAGGCS